MNPKLLLQFFTFLTVFSCTAHAALFDRGRGMIYDDQMDITWLQDTNYASTSGYAEKNAVDELFYTQLSPYPSNSNIIRPNGNMSWAAANQWANDLVYAGYDDWRLPSTGRGTSGEGIEYDSKLFILRPTGVYPPALDPGIPAHYIGFYKPNYGSPSSDTPSSELGSLYYLTLGNTSDVGIAYPPSSRHGGGVFEYLCSFCMTNTGPFLNIPTSRNPNKSFVGYWLAGASKQHGSVETHYFFDIASGRTINEDGVYFPVTPRAWAVKSGDVMQTPIPSTILLFGSGVIALFGLKKRAIA